MYNYLPIHWFNSRLFLALLSLTLSFKVAILPSLAAQTQPLESLNSDTTLPPPKGDAPDDTAGGSSRDGGYCVADKIVKHTPGFTALMPTYSETDAERPTFLIYIPETTAKKIFFSLKDANEDYYYQTTISLPGKSGLLRFQLPNDAPKIASNKKYTWSIGLICKQKFDPSDPTFTGVIQRVENEKISK